MSCPSWQWQRTGYRWSPVRTLPVAPLWCDLGCRSRTVVVIKAAAKTRLNRNCGAIKNPTSLPTTFRVQKCRAPPTFGGRFFCSQFATTNFCFLFLPVSCSLLLETHLSSIYKMFSHRFDVMLQLCDKNTVASSIPRQEYCSIINSATRIL